MRRLFVNISSHNGGIKRNNHYLYTIKPYNVNTIKRTILLVASVFVLQHSQVSAQETPGRVGFTVNEVALGGGFYNDGHSLKPVYAASYLLGRHFDQHWYAGVSATCAFSTYYAGYIYEGSRVYDHSFGLRLLLNGRYHLLERKVSPFIGVDVGGAHIPGEDRFMSPYASCQLGVRWILNTHNVIGFNVGPGVSTSGYNELLFRLTFEFN